MLKEIERDLDVNQYLYSVSWSDPDSAFIGRVAEFPSLAAHGNTSAAALHEIQSVVGYVIEDLMSSKEPIPIPLSREDYSGKFNVRVPVSMHRRLSIRAAEERTSLNGIIVVLLENALTKTHTVMKITQHPARTKKRAAKKTKRIG